MLLTILTKQGVEPDMMCLFCSSRALKMGLTSKTNTFSFSTQFGGEKSNRVDTDVPNDKIRIPEELNDVDNHFGKMRKDQALIVEV